MKVYWTSQYYSSSTAIKDNHLMPDTSQDLRRTLRLLGYAVLALPTIQKRLVRHRYHSLDLITLEALYQSRLAILC